MKNTYRYGKPNSLIIPRLEPGLSQTGGEQWPRPRPHTPPVNANHMWLLQQVSSILFTFPLFFPLFHFIKCYSHSLFSLLSHTLYHSASASSLSLSLMVSFSQHAAEENKNKSEAREDCESDRRSGEWREPRSPWSTASCLNCSWGSKANMQETLWGSHTYSVRHTDVLLCMSVMYHPTSSPAVLALCWFKHSLLFTLFVQNSSHTLLIKYFGLILLQSIAL